MNKKIMFMGFAILASLLFALNLKNDINQIVFQSFTNKKLINKIPRANEVKEVVFQIGGKQAQKVILKELDNISEIIRVGEKLQNYTKNDYKCESQDVKIEFILNNGSKNEVNFEQIKPIDDYFINIFNSIEVKKQTIDIFKIKKEDIVKVKFESSKKIYSYETTEHKVIDVALKNVVKSYETNNFIGTQNFYEIGDVKFYDKNNTIISSNFIFREDTEWNDLFNSNLKISKLNINPQDVSKIFIKDGKSGKELILINEDLKKKVLDSYYYGTVSDSILEVKIDLSIKNTNNSSLYGSYLKGQVPPFISELMEKQ